MNRHFNDWYRVLDVTRNATQNDIKKSFRKLALSYHPDVTGNDKHKTEKFKTIKVAYEILANEVSRRKYDIEIGNKRVHMKSQTRYTGPSTTTSTYTYTEGGQSYTYRYTVTRSNTAGNRTSGTPRGYNMDEWNAWHYGENSFVQDSVRQTNSWMNDANNKHYEYYRKKRDRERAQNNARMMAEEEDKKQKEAKSQQESSDNLKQRRSQRQREDEFKTKNPNSNNNSFCLIS